MVSGAEDSLRGSHFMCVLEFYVLIRVLYIYSRFICVLYVYIAFYVCILSVYRVLCVYYAFHNPEMAWFQVQRIPFEDHGPPLLSEMVLKLLLYYSQA